MPPFNFTFIGICMLHAILGTPTILSACQEPDQPSSEKWYTDLDEATAESKRTGRPILMEINGRPWCPPCNAQGEKIINHPDFQAWAGENVILLDVKVGKGYNKNEGNPIWAEQLKKHKIPGIPAAVFIDQRGDKMGVVYPKDDVQQWLGAAKNIITAHAVKRSNRSQSDSSQVIPLRLTPRNRLSVPALLDETIALNLMFQTAVDSVSLARTTIKRFPEIRLEQDNDEQNWMNPSKSRSGRHSLKISGLLPQEITLFDNLHSDLETDGSFGPNSLSSKLWAIDFDRSAIRLLSELPDSISEWQKLGLETKQGMMFINGALHVDNKSATHKFMIHSGYSGFALLDDKFVSSNPFLEKLKFVNRSELTDSAEAKHETSTVKLPKFKIGGFTFENAPVSVSSGEINPQEFSVLGGDFLKRFNLIFDTENNVLYLKKSRYFSSEHQ